MQQKNKFSSSFPPAAWIQILTVHICSCLGPIYLPKRALASASQTSASPPWVTVPYFRFRSQKLTDHLKPTCYSGVLGQKGRRGSPPTLFFVRIQAPRGSHMRNKQRGAEVTAGPAHLNNPAWLCVINRSFCLCGTQTPGAIYFSNTNWTPLRPRKTGISPMTKLKKSTQGWTDSSHFKPFQLEDVGAKSHNVMALNSLHNSLGKRSWVSD